MQKKRNWQHDNEGRKDGESLAQSFVVKIDLVRVLTDFDLVVFSAYRGRRLLLELTY